MHRPQSRTQQYSSARRTWRGASIALAAGLALVAAGRAPRPAVAQVRSEFVPTFSTSARVRQQVEHLNVLAGRKLWDEWLNQYQQLVDDPRDLVVPRDEEFMVGVRYQCHQMLAALPAGVRQKYRALRDPDAKRIYDKAVAENDSAAMRDVYSRYRFSSYGSRALLWLADRSLDEGRSEVARVAYSRLAHEPGTSIQTLFRYAMAAGSAGKPAEAKAVLDRIKKEYGGQPVQVAGQKQSAAAACDLLAKSLRHEAPVTAGRWTSFAGTQGTRQMSPALGGELKKLWDYTVPSAPEVSRGQQNSGVNVFMTNYASTRARFSFLTFPTISGDRIWLQTPRSITALNAKDGTVAWEQQEFFQSRDELTQQNGDPRSGGLMLRSGRPVQAAPTAEANRVVTRMPLTAGDRESGKWPNDFAIVMLDGRSGKQLWRKLPGGELPGMYFNVPTLQANTVLTGVATFKGGITEYSAVAMDAGTGEPLWTTYLGGGSDPLSVTDGSPAAVKDGLVWIESTLYTLSALDLITGEVRLIYHYDPGHRRASSGFDTTPTLTNEPISLIGAGDGPIVFCPRWGQYVVALDPVSGKLLWSSPKGARESAVGSLFAVDDKQAYLCGNHLQSIHLNDGMPGWTWDPDAASSSVGFATLCGDRIYVPVEGKIHVLSAADRSELQVLDISQALGEVNGMVSILPLQNMILVSTRDHLLAFGPK